MSKINLTLENLEDNKFYTSAEVSSLFRVSSRTVNNWIKNGDLNSTKVGAKNLIRGKDVKSFYLRANA